MSLRNHIQSISERGELITIVEPVSTAYEIAALLKKLEPKPVLFENVRESKFRVVGNLFCNKNQFADYLGISVADIIPTLTRAIEAPSPLSELKSKAESDLYTPPCQEIVQFEPNLDEIPILYHFPGDGGPYITSGVVVTSHPTYGQNLDFHRCMKYSPREMAVRVVKGRHFDAFLEDLGQVDVAICVGNTPNILAAGATSVQIGLDELRIAHALEPFRLTRAKTVNLMIPADAEFVLEGTVYRDRRHAEGPFVDLTGTQDHVRIEPIFAVKAITHRNDAEWQALLPGSLEHKLLMGMPREPTIYREVNRVVKCLDVNVNPGGCSWLHAIVQIDKQHDDDGLKAIRAAFAGHKSCKHVFVVDKDVNLYDPLEVEWAMATRFQGDRDLVVLPPEPGSSLDPSAEPGTKMTTKMGFDLTAPFGETRSQFEKIPYPEVAFEKFTRS
jgi:2,5-furandicarboxylate decarboxylase 1